jgi:hypothetical protein
MKMCRGVEVYFTGRFTAGERARGVHWIGGCMDPRASLDAVKKSIPPGPGRPARGPPPSRLTYYCTFLLKFYTLNKRNVRETK